MLVSMEVEEEDSARMDLLDRISERHGSSSESVSTRESDDEDEEDEYGEEYEEDDSERVRETVFLYRDSNSVRGNGEEAVDMSDVMFRFNH